MAKFTDCILPEHEAMIGQQSVFFVATAVAEGRINLSPKGYDCFRVLGPNRVAYLDLAGSGNETHAHLVADGRITVMMTNFQQIRNGLNWPRISPFCRAPARSATSRWTACRRAAAGACH